MATVPAPTARRDRLVIAASSLGTVFEWYDFYLYGLLATIISSQFFSGVNETTGFIFALAAFAAGFAVRPFGALVFGRIGDLVGRKYTFLVTMGIMGLSTFLVGLLPSYASVGVAAPVALVTLRLLQGLALGGEYGGAATYVAEHAPPGRRGFYTSWIQTTATLGLFAALLVVIGTRTMLGEEAFADWGWRVPFLLSILLLAVSLWIRLQLEESPVFQKMKAEGTTSKAPLRESFARWGNLQDRPDRPVRRRRRPGGGLVYRAILRALLPREDAQGRRRHRQHPDRDRAGAGDALLRPVRLAVGPDRAQADHPGRVRARGADLFPAVRGADRGRQPGASRGAATGSGDGDRRSGESARSSSIRSAGTSSTAHGCDVAKSYLAKAGISYDNAGLESGQGARSGSAELRSASPIPGSLSPDARKAAHLLHFQAEAKAALSAAGYPAKADPAQVNKPLVVAILFLLVLYVTMVYGPIAALLVELFPSRIRYSSMSLPYHIGNGWFGGFLPTTAFAMVAATGDIYYGLWYPIGIAVLTLVVGLFLLPETRGRRDRMSWDSLVTVTMTVTRLSPPCARAVRFR